MTAFDWVFVFFLGGAAVGGMFGFFAGALAASGGGDSLDLYDPRNRELLDRWLRENERWPQ
jgi:hypothetical protein